MKATTTEIPLPALKGSSLLGFLAALGVFRTITESHPAENIRLKWQSLGGSSYCPVLECRSPLDIEDLLRSLHATLTAFADHYTVSAHADLKIPLADFRRMSEKAANEFLNETDPVAASMIAAFGCDAIGNEDGNIEDTGFRTMSGAGHQHFLEFMNVLAKETTLEHLREAIVGPWLYRDPSPIMRWDAEDDRRYALRWDEPAKDPVRTVRGANRLAIAALPLFPVVPISNDAIATTGFRGRGSRGTFVTWPLWSGWANLDTVRSILAMPALQNDDVTSLDLQSIGICAIYRSQRITLGKYRNFTPAESL